jgi:hypothetical protein
LHIILDTFTVLNPDRYHIQTYGLGGLLPDTNFFFEALHARIDTAASDLYVNPLGNDTNSGLTPYQPLKTLAFALTKIVTSPVQARKIYLSNGQYSKNTNSEKFPINIRSYVDIIGESRESTVFDADSSSYFFEGSKLINGYSIKNLSFQNGYGFEIWDNASGIILTQKILFHSSTVVYRIRCQVPRGCQAVMVQPSGSTGLKT